MLIVISFSHIFNQGKVEGKEFTLHPATTLCFDMFLKLFGWWVLFIWIN